MKKSTQTKKVWIKMRLFISLKVLLLLLFIPWSYAHTHGASEIKTFNKTPVAQTITGTVTDANNQPLIGASVVLEGTTKGAVTDENGNFTLNIDDAEKNGNLIVSFVGYDKLTIPISGQSTINIILQETGALNEVVVIGYGTQKKSSLTGAVSKFKDEKLDEAPVSRLDQALQGKIAGVQIQNISAEAGAAPKINIRGISSINAGASPLVVVDGQPVPDGLAYINMTDVESVEVLKDAASAAIYGSRGASGVILITTKSGKSEKPQFNFKYSIGQKTPYSRYPIMTTSEQIELLFQEAALKAQDPSVTVKPTGTAIATDAERATYVIEKTMLDGNGTDYQSESLRTGTFQNIMLSASGGKKDVRYFISGGYQSDEGMMNKSNFEKLNIRTKVDVDLNKRLKVSLNLNPSYSTRESPSENFTNFMRYPSFLPVYHNEKTAAFVRQNAQWANIKAGDFAHPRHFTGFIYSGTMPDGSAWTSAAAATPFASAQNNPRAAVLNQDRNTDEYRLQGAGNIILNLAPGLDFKTMASLYLNNGNTLNWNNRNANSDGEVNRGVYITNNYLDLLSENTLTYSKQFKGHALDLLAGYTVQKTRIGRDQITGLDFPGDDIRTLNNASQIDKAGTFNTRNQIGLLSYLGRINYAFNDKYLLSAGFRADGSSYFGPGNKWGTFPSVSLGWVATQEKFLSNIKGLDKLKIRASYGVSGNNRILDFGFVDLMFAANYPLGSGNGNLVAGQSPSSTIIANKDITWESTFQNNLGFDVAILKNRIELTVDVYKSKTDKLLLQQSAMAFTGVPLFWNNIGSLENKGIELELTTRNITTKNFKWTTSANFSRTRNKILELGSEAFLLNQGERTEVYRNKVGDPLIMYFGFKTDGVWLSQAEIDKARADGLKSSLSNVFIPGGLKLVDLNGDKTIDNNDRTVIGNPYPDFFWGLSNTFNFKGFDAGFTLQGSQGGTLINGDPNYNETKQRNKAYTTNRWVSPMFPGDGKTPYSTVGFNWMLTDYVVEDASYYSLREVNIGYRLPKKAAQSVKLKGTRVYFSAQNLYFKSGKNYRGLNPEGRFVTGPYSSSLVDGYQRGSFPIPKTAVLGVDISF